MHPLADHSVAIEIPVGVDAKGAVLGLRHGGGDPSFRRTADGVIKATALQSGAVSVRVRFAGAVARVEAWGEGAPEALELAPGWLGLCDSADGFDPSRHETVLRLHRRSPGLRFGRFPMLFEYLVPTVLGQRVSVDEAKRSYRQLVRKAGQRAPGPFDLLMPPSPQFLGALGSGGYHEAGVERARADIIQRLARQADRLERLVDYEPRAAYTALRAVRGVGPWTIAMAAQSVFADADAVPIGDYKLPHLVTWNLAGEPRGDDDRMLALLEPFAGHRARVLRLLKGGGARPPRYGPKLAPRDRWAW